jgi:putative inorganic carbon (HCO3(-)) transporter
LTSRFRHLATSITAAEPLLLVTAVVCLVLLPLRFAPIGLGLMAVAWLVRWLATGRFGVRSPADWSLVVLLVMVPVTLYVTPLPEVTWRALAYLAAGLLAFNSLVFWAHSERRLWLAVWRLIGAGVVLALVAPFGVEWFAETKLLFFPASIYSVMPLLLPDPIHPNVMAGALALVLPLPLALLLLGSKDIVEGLPRWLRKWLRKRLRRPWPVRVVLAIAWLMMAAVLALTKSRGGYLATAAGILLLLIVWRRWAALSLLVVAEGIALAWSRLGGAGLVDFLVSTHSIHGWEGRRAVWLQGVDMIRSAPLTGIGMGLYPFLLASGGRIDHVHNLFLQVGVDLGLPGLVAYLALWLTCLVMAWRAYAAYRKARHMGLAALAAGVGTSLVVMGLHGLVDAVTWGTKPAVVAWAMMGLAIALHRYAHERAAMTPEQERQ